MTKHNLPLPDVARLPSPCFVLDENRLRANLERLRQVKDQAGCQILLALKGFSLYHAFPIVAEYLDGTTASSLHEAKLAREHFGRRPHVYAPAYLDNEFDEILELSSHLTFNSLNQYRQFRSRVKAFGQQNSRSVSCGLRINPQYSEVETDLYNPCIPGSRLGMTADQLGSDLPEGIAGLHFHTLCENNSFTLEKTLEAVETKFGHLLHQCQWVNMGGGHLITHKDYQTDHLIELIVKFRKTYDVQVILEPGSAIAWQTGWLVCQVLDLFDSGGIQAAVLDCSISAHMPDCIEMPYKPRVLGATDPKPKAKRYRLGGMTCLAGDFVGDYAFKQELNIGDRVVFDDMMHYTMVKTTTFNGVNLPSIGMIDLNGKFTLLREYGYASFKDRLG